MVFRIFYVIVGEVAIDPSTLNYELVSQYQLFFKVSDPSGLDDYMDIFVPITDVNENPVIQNLPDDAYIVEGSTGGVSVFDVNAIDVDGDSLAYIISTWPDNTAFYVTNTGETILDYTNIVLTASTFIHNYNKLSMFHTEYLLMHVTPL